VLYQYGNEQDELGAIMLQVDSCYLIQHILVEHTFPFIRLEFWFGTELVRPKLRMEVFVCFDNDLYCQCVPEKIGIHALHFYINCCSGWASLFLFHVLQTACF